ncbi:MAG: hypothetical protein FWG57_02860 [Endomicrobia bacterium]|nr:hypothetical protein [Endomicrobiia bacterium]
MERVLFFVMVFAVCGFTVGCGEKAAKQNEISAVRETAAVESAPGEEIREVRINDIGNMPLQDNSKLAVNSEFMMKVLEDGMQLDSKDFDFYQIASFSNHDRKEFKYYMGSYVQIFDDISSLLILAASEHEHICRLVNYDKNNKYIASLIVGYDEWADSSNGIDSVINLKGAPYYIELTSRSAETKEIIKTEVLASGKFNEISRMNVGQ